MLSRSCFNNSSATMRLICVIGMYFAKHVLFKVLWSSGKVAHCIKETKRT